MILFTFTFHFSLYSSDERKLAPNLNECWWVAALDVVGMSDDVAAFVDIVRRDFIVKNTKWIRRKDDAEKRNAVMIRPNVKHDQRMRVKKEVKFGCEFIPCATSKLVKISLDREIWLPEWTNRRWNSVKLLCRHLFSYSSGCMPPEFDISTAQSRQRNISPHEHHMSKWVGDDTHRKISLKRRGMQQTTARQKVILFIYWTCYFFINQKKTRLKMLYNERMVCKTGNIFIGVGDSEMRLACENVIDMLLVFRINRSQLLHR